MSSEPHEEASPHDSQAPKPLSCVSCRARKVKCNKEYPCGPCVRTGVNCVFPVRKRNRRPRQTRQTELLDRLARLEEIVSKVDSKALSALDDADKKRQAPAGAAQSASETQLKTIGPRLNESGPLSDKSPETVMLSDDPSSRYLSGEFWTNLCKEFDGLRAALDRASDTDSEDGDNETTPGSNSYSDTPASVAPSFTLLGGTVSVTPDPLQHPSSQRVHYLMATYFSNVDLVMKILHRPTVTDIFQHFITSGDSRPSSPSIEALFFAMYFAAVTSLSDDACRANLAEDRATLVERYRLATEVALARADYLNTTVLEPLQAFAIYLAVLRCHTGDRTSWTLLALAIRLAQALRLHRDGDGSAYTPFVAEMRRRLWWQLVTLDVRGTEDRGTEAMVSRALFNTVMVTSINDDDFGPHTVTPLQDASGPTDVTFMLCAAVASRTVIELNENHVPSADEAGGASSLPSEEVVIAKVQELERRFIHNADQNHIPSALASRVATIVIFKLWLTMQYPFRLRQSRGASRIPRADMLRIAVSVMELGEDSGLSAGAARYVWYTVTYVQWHALSVALAELCSQTEGELVERAWKVIDKVFPVWGELVADTKRGALWKPIKKLYKKAKAARMAAVARAEAADDDAFRSAQQPPAPPEMHLIDIFEAVRNGNVFWDGAQTTNPEVLPNPQFAGGPDFASVGLHDGLAVESMDWTNWNEFVTDTQATEQMLGSMPWFSGVG